MTPSQRYHWFALLLRDHHMRHCDGATCNISLSLIREMAEAAGAEPFTAEEKALFS